MDKIVLICLGIHITVFKELYFNWLRVLLTKTLGPHQETADSDRCRKMVIIWRGKGVIWYLFFSAGATFLFKNIAYFSIIKSNCINKPETWQKQIPTVRGRVNFGDLHFTIKMCFCIKRSTVVDYLAFSRGFLPVWTRFVVRYRFGEVAVVERVKMRVNNNNKWMYQDTMILMYKLSVGTKTVAVVDRWSLVGFQP